MSGHVHGGELVTIDLGPLSAVPIARLQPKDGTKAMNVDHKE